MVFIAKTTLKNAYDQVLFRQGCKYHATDEDSKRFVLLNELHSETSVRKSKVHDDFIVEE